MLFLAVVLAGLVGTWLMTIFTNVFSLLAKKPFFVIQILGSMLAYGVSYGDSLVKAKYPVASFLHYSIGILFSYGFIFLIDREIFSLDILSALIYGALIATVGVIGWLIFFGIHPLQVRINKAQYLVLIWFGHIVFAIGMFLVYKAMPGSIATDEITICR